MILQIIDDKRDQVLLEIEAVEQQPYGIEVVNQQGGVALSAQLRLELSQFFLEGGPAPKTHVKANVVRFPNYEIEEFKED
jgi:hypothetical protein